MDLGHDTDFSNPPVLSLDNFKIRLQVKETLLIKQFTAYK